MMGPCPGFLYFVILTSLASARIEENADFTSVDDEDEEPLRTIRNDPSEFEGLSLGSGMGDVIKLGVAEGQECPHSCFCEEEDSYASCIGDGQWAPPFLPSWIKRLEMRNFFLFELERLSVHLPGLQEMHLQQCNLSKIHRDAFISLTNLDHLDLSQNHLEVLGPNSLNGLTGLKHLDISSNNLKNLSRPFLPLLSLEHLNLRDNKLQSLDSDTFSGLGKVQYVNLDGNDIHSVDVAAFQHLGSLAHLILSNNPLSNLVRLNFFGSRLQYIDVSNIGISKVPQSLTQFVRDLRLAKNNIKEIHRGDLDSYPYLGLLVLDDNGLELLEEDALGRHEYLARFWLNGNRLKYVPQSLPISLKALYMEENMLSRLSNTDFGGLINLEQLYLQRNEIMRITNCAFCDLTSLKTLDLQANKLANITESIFIKLYNLESLDLSQNPLLALHSQVFLGIGSLRVLQISRIRTSVTISETLFGPLKSLQILEMYGSPRLVEMVLNSTRLLHSLRGVREINLMHNELSWIRSDFFSFFPKLTMIKLSGNSWNCSTRGQILWLKEKLLSSPISFYRSYSVKCSSPSSLGFKPVLLLNDEDFPPTIPPSTTIAEVATTKMMIVVAPIAQRKHLILPIDNLTDNLKVSHKDPSALVPTYHSSIKTHQGAALEKKAAIPINARTVEDLELSELSTLQSLSVGMANNTRLNDNESNIDQNIDRSEEADFYYNALIDTKGNFSESPSITAPPSNKYSFSISYNDSSLKRMRSSTLQALPNHELPTPFAYKDKTAIYKIATQGIKPAYLSTKFSEEHAHRTSPNRIPEPTVQLSMHEIISTTDTSSSENDPWVFLKHAFIDEPKYVDVHILKKDYSLIIAAALVSACLGIALIVGGYMLARRISKKNRRMHMWKNRCTSFWNGREGMDGEIIVGIGDTGAGTIRESDGTAGLVTESHHGLNNRLYLLLQRSSDTGITSESLPDPTIDSWPRDGYSLIKSDTKLYS